MIYKSKAPFRLGLAGGGTDINQYSELFGGAVLNATVSLYAQTTINPRSDKKIIIATAEHLQEFDSIQAIPYNGELDLAKAVYNVLIREYELNHRGFELTTTTDVPTGSGLGTSSTIVVSILGAFLEWHRILLNQHEIAALAYHIEREELGMAGGKQDQYAATFGGFNFIEFLKEEVVVNQLDTGENLINEINENLILYYTRTNRESHEIILKQIDNVEQKAEMPLQAMHDLKNRAIEMRNAIIEVKVDAIGDILNESWISKKQMAVGITNEYIDKIYAAAIEAGAIGGKISGAGGGGFMIFYVRPDQKTNLIKALDQFDGEVINYQFTQKGMEAWTEE
ncbi:hypothetical protein JYT74_02170 [Crocinitomix catalasitica]|nr:hypothetical protein [Crocinitomix catalasitica]